MRAAATVEVDGAADGTPRLADTVIGPQIDLLVFEAAPRSLDKDIIPPSPFWFMLMAMPFLASTLVKTAPVNCEP